MVNILYCNLFLLYKEYNGQILVNEKKINASAKILPMVKIAVTMVLKTIETINIVIS